MPFLTRRENMVLSIETKKEKISASILAVAFLGFIIASFPQIQSSVLFFAQKAVLHRELRDISKWMDIFFHLMMLCATTVFILGFLNFSVWGKQIKKQIVQSFKAFMQELKKKETITLLVINFIVLYIVFFKVIDADFLFQDDVFRHYKGDRSWIEFSRYLSEFFSIIVHTSISISDCAPLLFFLSIFLMVLTNAVIDYSIFKKIQLHHLLALSLIFISPFYAQNFSYRYDCVYMVLSLFFPAIPFLFMHDKKAYFTASFIGTILSCITYQAGTMLYAIMVIFIVLHKISEKENLKQKEIWDFTLLSIAAFAFAYIYYYLLLAKKVSDTGYFDASIRIQNTLLNMIALAKIALKLHGGTWIKIFTVFSACAFLYGAVKNSRQKKSTAVLLAVFALFFSFAISYGPYLILSHPPFTPRSLMGFNVWVAMFSLFAISEVKSKISRAIVFCLFYGCTVFMNVYGTCLAEQKKYDTFREELLIADLNRVCKDGKFFYKITGTCGNTENNAVALRNFPVISYLIGGSIMTERSIDWNDYVLGKYNVIAEEIDIPKTHGMPLLVSTKFHDIYGKQNIFYIVLKEK